MAEALPPCEEPDLAEGEASPWGPQATPPDRGATVWDEESRRRRARPMPELSARRQRGNTSSEDLGAARAAALREAQGRGFIDPSEWAEQLEAGDRTRASSALGRSELTHNAGSGFGLA